MATETLENESRAGAPAKFDRLPSGKTTAHYLSTKQVCEVFGIARITLFRWRDDYGFPWKVTPDESATLYSVKDMKAWAKRQNIKYNVKVLESFVEEFGE